MFPSNDSKFEFEDMLECFSLKRQVSQKVRRQRNLVGREDTLRIWAQRIGAGISTAGLVTLPKTHNKESISGCVPFPAGRRNNERWRDSEVAAHSLTFVGLI